MITHEEARESYKRLFESYLDGDWAPFPTRSDLDTYRVYIAQQEKKDKLLDLYQTLLKQYVVEIDTPLQQHFTFLASEYKIIKGIITQIKALEEELK